MTDEERYRIIGQVVSNHEEAKKILAALLAKAKSLSTMVADVAKALDQVSDFSRPEGGDAFIVRERHGGSRKYAVRAWPSFDQISDLFAEIASTHTEIATLERQRRELGISS